MQQLSCGCPLVGSPATTTKGAGRVNGGAQLSSYRKALVGTTKVIHRAACESSFVRKKVATCNPAMKQRRSMQLCQSIRKRLHVSVLNTISALQECASWSQRKQHTCLVRLQLLWLCPDCAALRPCPDCAVCCGTRYRAAVVCAPDADESGAPDRTGTYTQPMVHFMSGPFHV